MYILNEKFCIYIVNVILEICKIAWGNINEKKSIAVLSIVFILLFIFILNINKDNNYYENLEKTSKDEKVTEICNKIKSMDITIKESPMNLSNETHMLYKQAYLDILKNKIPSSYNDNPYIKGIGIHAPEKFEDYFDDRYHVSFYYYDLDGDGLPELGLDNGFDVSIIKYYPDINKFNMIYAGMSTYQTILGTGQIWHHDGLHAGHVRDLYITLNGDGKWVTSVEFEEYFPEPGLKLDDYYYVSINGNEEIGMGEEIFRELITPFLELKKNAIPAMSMEEIFGELL